MNIIIKEKEKSEEEEIKKEREIKKAINYLNLLLTKKNKVRLY